MDMARAMQALADGDTINIEELRSRTGDDIADDPTRNFDPDADAQHIVDLG